MSNSLAPTSIQYLKDFWYNKRGGPGQPYANRERLGTSYPLRDNKELYQFVEDLFETKEPSGQLCMLTGALGCHADVLWDIGNEHWQHWTTRQPGRTRYVVLETDAKDPMHTTIFQQTVEPSTWKGVLTSDVIMNKSDLKLKRTSYNPLWYSHHKEIFNQRLSIDSILQIPIGTVIEWKTNQLHMGQSFESCGATYKLHMTVISKE